MGSVIQRRRKRLHGTPRSFYVVLSILAFISLAPIFVLVFNSLKTSAEIGRNPLGPPLSPDFSNYVEAWTQGGFAVTMRNSAFLVAATVVGVCLISGLAAYALSRLDIPGGRWVVVYLFVGTTVPPQLFIVPLFFLWVDLSLANTLIGLVIIYWALFAPFTTLLLRSYLLALPRELEEAARVDGANELQVMKNVVLPLAWPGLLVVALVAALMAWNEFFFAITFIQTQELKPVTTSFLAFQNRFGNEWGLTSAAAIIVILPILVLFLALQRKFIAGLTAGALKG